MVAQNNTTTTIHWERKRQGMPLLNALGSRGQNYSLLMIFQTPHKHEVSSTPAFNRCNDTLNFSRRAALTCIGENRERVSLGSVHLQPIRTGLETFRRVSFVCHIAATCHQPRRCSCSRIGKWYGVRNSKDHRLNRAERPPSAHHRKIGTSQPTCTAIFLPPHVDSPIKVMMHQLTLLSPHAGERWCHQFALSAAAA